MPGNTKTGFVEVKHFSALQRLKRAVRFKLIIPIKRSTKSPEFTARGVGVGMFWALTPSLGVQMIFCLITWFIAKRFFYWEFSLFVAMAWTWTTNVITAIPCFYLFFVTGQLFLGRTDDLSGYMEFSRQWENLISQNKEMGFFSKLWADMSIAGRVWGIPLVLGCLPWSIIGGFLSYYLSLSFILRHRLLKQRRKSVSQNKSDK